MGRNNTNDSDVYGYVDDCVGGVVSGWVINTKRSNERCVVEAHIGDDVVAESVADQFRADLKDNGMGDGFGGFLLYLPDFLPTGTVEIRERETGYALTGAVLIQEKTRNLGMNPNRTIDASEYEELSALIGARSAALDTFLTLFDLDCLIWRNREPGIFATAEIVRSYLAGNCVLRGPLFDDQDYKTLHPDVRESGMPALLHYALYGRKEKRLPTLLFVPEEISTELSDVAVSESIARGNLFNGDYLNFLAGKTSVGWHRLVDVPFIRGNPAFSHCRNADILKAIHNDEIVPNVLFGVDFYKKMCAVRGIDVDRCALLHYMTTGWKMGVDPHPLFDATFYRVDQKSSSGGDTTSDPLSEFIKSEDQSKYSPSPFIELTSLRHLVCQEGYDHRSDWQLMCDTLGGTVTWWPIHPHLHRLIIGFLSEQDGLHALRKHQATVADVVDLVAAIRLASSISDEVSIAQIEEVDVSIIILNYNKPIFTILSAFSASRALQGLSGEVLVVDNGSDPFCTELLYRYLSAVPRVRIIATRQNRYFGEGNNLALDVARGRYVLFLNNDAVIRPESLRRMVGTLENRPEVGAVAPVMILPTGAIQEIGGSISGCGLVTQRGKFLSFEEFLLGYPDRNRINECDYASAACILLRRSVVQRVVGFDVTFEPFYFEDTDLCARIRAHGHKIAVHTGAFAVHVENGSTRDFLGAGLGELIGRQRHKFASRWLGTYEDLGQSEIAQKSARFDIADKYQIFTESDVAPGYSGKPIAWIFTPYDIRIGGGERYILSMARAIGEHYEAWLLTPSPMSKARLSMVMDDLEIPACRLHATTLERTARWARPELYVAMGNEIEPPTPAHGSRNIFVCQFPFPIQHNGKFSVERAHGYDAYVVYSAYAAATTRRMMERYGIARKPIHVIAPSVPIPSLEERQILAAQKSVGGAPLMALNIGRFTVQGHPKRQDVLIHMAEILPESGISLELELYGGVGTESADAAFFASIAERGSKVGVRVRANAGRLEVRSALQRATFYVHPCGMGWYPGLAPERVEHFGITVVEAMAHGAIPIVYKWGGPAEIVAAAGVGDTFESMEELLAILKRRHDQPVAERSNEIAIAVAASDRYQEKHFMNAVRTILA